MIPVRVVASFLVLVLFMAMHASGQITGKVYDAEAQSPLQGAVIVGEGEQTLSASNGSFTMAGPVKGFLVISHLGYNTDTIETKGKLKIYLRPDYTRLEQIIVHGPLLQNTLMNLPSCIVLLDKESLSHSSGISYVEQLNRLPGIYVHSGSANTNRITVRGIGSRTPYASKRVKAYFNDIPLTSGDGTTAIEDIDPGVINTLEIVKGSKSAVYGSGLGGVILISGRKYLEAGLHGHAGIEAGSFGTLKPILSLQWKKGKVSASTAYSFTSSDGRRQNSAYQRHNVNLYASIKSNYVTTDVLVHAIDLKTYIPSSLNKETFRSAPESAAPGWLAVKGFEEYQRVLSGISNRVNITGRLSNTTILYTNYYKGYESRPFNILDDESLQAGLKTSFDYSSQAWHLRTGIELMFENYYWQVFETNEGVQADLINKFSETRNPVNLFAHAGYTFSDGSIVETGISYNFLGYQLSDHLPDSLDQSGDFRYRPVLSPFLGINIPLGSVVRMYASAGHGFSYPTVEETLLPDGQANPDLKPESGIHLELGTRISAFDGNLFTDANVYLLFVDNLLVTERPTENIFYGENAGKSRHMGFEFSTSIRLNKDQYHSLPKTRLDLSLAISDNRFTNFTDDGTNHSNNALPGIPSAAFYTGASFQYTMGLYAQIQYSFTGKQYLDDGNTGLYGSYDLVHLKLGYRLPDKVFSPDFFFGIQNVFNRQYASMLLVNAPSFGNAAPRYYYPGHPRSFYGGVSVHF